MARITPIRISENDRKEYARLVRNARAKIRRTAKNHKVDLEGVVKLPSSIDDFSTRKEFNEWKKEVGSFTNRHNQRYQFVTNEYGVTTTKSELHHIQTRRRREQRVAREQYDKVKNEQVKQGGKAFATVEQRSLHFSKSDVTGIQIPKDFDFDEIRSKSRLDEIIEVGKRRQYPEYYDWRSEQMKMNFMKGLEESFDDEADELIDRLGRIPPSDFLLLYMGNEEFDFDELYYHDGEVVGLTNTQEQVNKLLAILDEYENDVRNPDLDNF